MRRVVPMACVLAGLATAASAQPIPDLEYRLDKIGRDKLKLGLELGTRLPQPQWPRTSFSCSELNGQMPTDVRGLANAVKEAAIKDYLELGLPGAAEHVRLTFPKPPPAEIRRCGSQTVKIVSTTSLNAYVNGNLFRYFESIKNHAGDTFDVSITSTPSGAEFEVWPNWSRQAGRTATSEGGVTKLEYGPYVFEVRLSGHKPCPSKKFNAYDDDVRLLHAQLVKAGEAGESRCWWTR